MSAMEKFIISEDSKFGIVLQCHDIEMSDHFHDFLTDNFDGKISFKFDVDHVSFFFGKEVSISDIWSLCKKFENGNT
jgi:hypothetical protein